MVMKIPSFCLLTCVLSLAAVDEIQATPSLRVLTAKDSIQLQNLAKWIDDHPDTPLCEFSENSQPTDGGRQVGSLQINEDVAGGLKLAAGIHPFSPDALFSPLQQAGRNVRSFCSLLTKSSRVHSDRVRSLPEVSDDPKYNQAQPTEQVSAFVFLESNPDAHFSWGEQSVPVEKGSMVVFDGQVPHHTVIEQGHVRLLGPFDTRTFRLVGEPAPDTAAPTLAPTRENPPEVIDWLFIGILVSAAIALGIGCAVVASLL